MKKSTMLVFVCLLGLTQTSTLPRDRRAPTTEQKDKLVAKEDDLTMDELFVGK